MIRLSKFEVKSIKKLFIEVFQTGNIYLFGSRVDEHKRGGDIDLYIELENVLETKEIMNLKSKFRLKLYDAIGEQKVDILVSKDRERSIEKEILRTGILL